MGLGSWGNQRSFGGGMGVSREDNANALLEPLERS